MLACRLDQLGARLEQDWPLSASFDIAEGERGDASGDAVVARADAATYRAKGQGRNVVQA